MVCIAAFIVLCLVSVFVVFLSIFRRDIGKRYWKTFKKAWGCVGKRVTLQKCETGFKDDVKNTLLSKVVLKNPKLVKPFSIGIEVASVLIVLVTVWSIVEASKAGLALWTLGTCNVQRPSACSLGAEACSIDGDSGPKNFIESIGYWFSDWGEIFGAMPDKFRSWDASNFDFSYVSASSNQDSSQPVAIDIFDPGCEVCLQSYKKQAESGFFEKNNVKLVPFPIQDKDGKFKFANSRLIVSYIYAVEKQGNPAAGLKAGDALASGMSDTPAIRIIDRIFMQQDDKHRSYQDLFNAQYSATEAETELKSWLTEYGYSEAEISTIADTAKADEISNIISKNNDIVVNNIHAKGIPTMIYNNSKHTGVYKD